MLNCLRKLNWMCNWQNAFIHFFVYFTQHKNVCWTWYIIFCVNMLLSFPWTYCNNVTVTSLTIINLDMLLSFWCQFHQCFTSSFCAQKRLTTWLSFCAFGIFARKSWLENVDEIDPCCHQHQLMLLSNAIFLTYYVFTWDYSSKWLNGLRIVTNM